MARKLILYANFTPNKYGNTYYHYHDYLGYFYGPLYNLTQIVIDLDNYRINNNIIKVKKESSSLSYLENILQNSSNF